MDDICYDVLYNMSLPNVSLISLEEFESRDEELLKTKSNRSIVEYYFTCTPCLPLFVLKKYSIPFITYVDADLFFYSNPASLYEEIGDCSIAIIEHRFPPHLKYLEKYGIYNVGWLSFKRDKDAFLCLEWWREQCIRWCYDRYEDGLFADQKYLDSWPLLFNKVVVLNHKGANLAPWNIANYQLIYDGGTMWVDEYPLIFFHFHGFKILRRWLYDSGLGKYGVTTRKNVDVLREIFVPYIQTLLEVSEKVSFLSGDFLLKKSVRKNKELLSLEHVKSLVSGGFFKVPKKVIFKIIRGDYILFFSDKMLVI